MTLHSEQQRAMASMRGAQALRVAERGSAVEARPAAPAASFAHGNTAVNATVVIRVFARSNLPLVFSVACSPLRCRHFAARHRLPVIVSLSSSLV